MRRCKTMLGIGLLAGLLAGEALAQPTLSGAMPMPAGARQSPAPKLPPPPGRDGCTPAQPCRSALNEPFYYTPSGDRQYINRR